MIEKSNLLPTLPAAHESIEKPMKLHREISYLLTKWFNKVVLIYDVFKVKIKR